MHFQSEEQLMEQAEFPGLAEHRTEHHRMLAEMLQSAHRLQHGKDVQTRQMLCALRDGYIEHIEGLDREYGPWLRDRNIPSAFQRLAAIQGSADFLQLLFGADILSGGSCPAEGCAWRY